MYANKHDNDIDKDNNYNDRNSFGILSSIFTSGSVAQILDFFLDFKEFDYSPGEIAKKTGLASRTIFRELSNLEKKQLIYNSRKIGKVNMYRLNTDFEAVLLLEKFVLEMSQLNANFRKTVNDMKDNDDINNIVSMPNEENDFN